MKYNVSSRIRAFQLPYSECSEVHTQERLTARFDLGGFGIMASIAVTGQKRVTTVGQ